ncbi:cysteine proteinase inhibitor 5 [Euphorbia lathyris]|uniref:cysteine proteinase inhibitor 5 n=1 Tax=Euphorbia lathyris TaxID=212925 RepID=UPI003313AFBA
MKRQSVLLCFFFFVAFAAGSMRGSGSMPGGWTPIKDLKDPHVAEIAQFAVSEYNNRSKTNLKLQSVVKGETQVVSGANYRLVLAVTGGGIKKYEAIVWEKPWAHMRNLTSFKPVKP